MTNKRCRLVVAGSVLWMVVLSGCGGGSSSKNTVQPLTITTSTLPTATVGTAYDQTVAVNGGMQPYIFSVSSGSLPAGLSLDTNSGKVSGTPTGASGTSSFSVTVNDAESPAAKATASLSIVVNGASTGLLKGNYAFLFSGYFNGYFTGAGSFVADGAGNISNGIVDTNGLTGPTNGTFTGSYSIDSDNLGTMHWVFTGSGGGSSTYAIALSSNGDARFIQYDSRGVQGSGLIKMQDTSAFSAAKITGTYAYGLVGIDGSKANRLALIGEFQSDGVSSLSNGLADLNDNGANSSSVSVTGTFAVASSGRGTVALNVGGLGTLNASFYIVSATELFLMEIDAVSGGNPLLSGDALQQTGAGSFSDASLSGTSVLEADGATSAPASSTVSLGLATVTTPGTLNLSLDVNARGTLSTSTQQLSYSVASSGRVSTTGTNGPVLYLVNQNQAFVLYPDSMVTFGNLEPQSLGPFTDVSLSGAYIGASITLGAAGTTEANALSADGNGNVTQPYDTSDGTHLQQGTQSMTYTIAADGRTLLTSQNSIVGISYIVSPTKVAVMGASSPSLSILEH
jgi:hypothetical protein